MPDKSEKKPIEILQDELNHLKTEMIHIKKYVRMIEAREQIKEEELKKIDESYVKPDKGWFW